MASALPDSGELHKINPVTYTVTNERGEFELRWSDVTRGAFPVPLVLDVTYISSNDAVTTSDDLPPVAFRVRRADGGMASDLFRATAATSDADLGQVVVDAARADEESAAYLTAREFFDTIVKKSANLRQRMVDVTVKTHVLSFGIFKGLTPFAREAWIAEGFAVQNPRTVAHELGHAVTWAALRASSAPMLPTDYMMNGIPGWARDSREFSKAAFLDGLADAWSFVWLMGGSKGDPEFTSDGKVFRVENGTVSRSDGAIEIRCRTVSRAWEFPFCHTAGLWDLLDSDDRVNLTIADVIDTLSSFAPGTADGQRDEGGLDGLNHLDFQRNAGSLESAVRRAWEWNGLQGGH